MNRKIQTSTVSESSSGEEKKRKISSTLMSIGNPIPHPRIVSWDPFKQFVAFVYDDSLHIHRIGIDRSLHPHGIIRSSPTSILWYNGTLFVATHTSIKAGS